MSLSLDHEDAEPEARQKERFAAFAKMFGEGRSFSGHERNCCYLNPGDAPVAAGQFANISAASGLDYPDDARSITLVDWDHDGDLDVWASNRNAPRLRLLRNEIPESGNFVSLSLVGNGTSTNRDAIGARVEIIPNVSSGKEAPKLIATLRAGEGFLSQSSKWVHFGLGKKQLIDKVIVSWPAGIKEEFVGVQINARNELKQGIGISRIIKESPRSIALAPNPQQIAEKLPAANLRLITRATMPPISYQSWDGIEQQLDTGIDKATLIILWASWCQPCLKELKEVAESKEQLDLAGIHVIALAVDGIGADTSDPENARRMLAKMEFPFSSGRATKDVLEGLQKMHDRQAAVKRPLPLPTSILLNDQRQLVSIYKGPLEIQSLLSDAAHLEDSAIERVAHAAVLPGRVVNNKTSQEILNVAQAEQRFKTAEMFEKYGMLEQAISEYDRILDLWPAHNHAAPLNTDASNKSWVRDAQLRKRGQIQALAYTSRGQLQQKQGDLEAAIDNFERVVAIKPDDTRIYFTLGKLNQRLNNKSKAIKSYGNVIERDPRNLEAYRKRAELYQSQGKYESAKEDLKQVIALDPGNPDAHQETGQLLLMLNDRKGALKSFSKAIEIDPGKVASLANRGSLHAASGNYDLAIEDLSSAVKLNPKSSAAYNNFAWLLATCNDPQYRDGEKAVIYATKACELLNWKSKDALDTLAAATAEMGNWKDAVKWQQKALDLADETSRTELRMRLRLYEAGKPYHQ